eukprot:CAMPEP_0177346350 /NCGR_PEP_ID=MMETSP0368-20130122/29138_1 /TAXON_ID=447022 ORGANISM="Scrippsiella hangoei-like, Strain SHHI-4" /NCGR_SAMPLE_ID=MMETSP0368 /ASSEMBLY_ACC=CAM_ASM_000363 /LENGTH=138 /DNA_ID=CAMNT_0018807995 /DNA_START=195 /DNA_END=611 /DNA_ORIENTATION=+
MHRTIHAPKNSLRNPPDLSGDRDKTETAHILHQYGPWRISSAPPKLPLSFPAGAGTVDFGGTGTCGCTGRSSIGDAGVAGLCLGAVGTRRLSAQLGTTGSSTAAAKATLAADIATGSGYKIEMEGSMQHSRTEAGFST